MENHFLCNDRTIEGRGLLDPAVCILYRRTEERAAGVLSLEKRPAEQADQVR